MRTRWAKAVIVLLVPILVLVWCPVTACAEGFSDTSSEGAAITVGLLIAVVAVLFIVSLRSDISNAFGKAPPPAVADEELASRLSLVLEQRDFNRGIRSLSQDAETEVANLGVGLRVQF